MMTASGQELYATLPRNARSERADMSMLSDGNLEESEKKKYEP
jgi:hypothetical protein